MMLNDLKSMDWKMLSTENGKPCSRQTRIETNASKPRFKLYELL